MAAPTVPATASSALVAAPRFGSLAGHGDHDADKAHRAVQRAQSILEDATATARVAATRLEAATAAMPAAQTKVAVSRGAVAAALAAANTAGRRANTARASYATIAVDYDAAQQRFSAARGKVDEIAQASYMGSGLSRINVLAAASGPADMMDRLSIVDQLMRTQQQDVNSLLLARRDARTQQDKAGLARREAEEAEADSKTKLAAAKQAQAAAVRAREALRKLTESRAAAVRLANSQRAAVLARYQAARAEEERVQAALRGWSAKSGEGRYSGGKLEMPVNGWKTSDFGYRYDPYYRVWQLHAGTDLAAGGGTPIHAAASGRVIRAGWNGGYGNYTCLSHGRIKGVSFQTCYGHQSAILVHVGEYVVRGEVIGRVGTTGASTGNHLHFETRFNGAPRNPLNYLPRCLC
ncbi:M23 family metallopeptidase [Actinoplanes sp. TBRC 11911]|uniref:M23 family metallopeptidase n=1 Tax=Actinoplanes sp. TBRC 11911 TaxID=2729386 RepID=UPI00145C49EC|nr:peptidoglycan DD-metalloendopeptidase family protein [Actinoplanes sp. TBRC 11911]NMO50938.1 M23 family metallopeptidase [Actinoplanes sp. TBRC 11911]